MANIEDTDQPTQEVRTLVSSIVTIDGEIDGPGGEPCSYCHEALHTWVRGSGEKKVFLCDPCYWESTAPYVLTRGVTEMDFTQKKPAVSAVEYTITERATGRVMGTRTSLVKAMNLWGMLNANAEHTIEMD